MRPSTQPLNDHSGALVLGPDQAPDFSLEALPPATFAELVRREGLLVFRDLGLDPEQFGQLATRMSRRTILDPTREFHAGPVQKVHAGTAPIALHSEHSNSPFRPDLIWFYCLRPAADRGCTTYADGCEVWRALSPGTQALFRERRIQYRRIFPAPIWKLFVAHMSEPPLDPAEVGEADLRALFAGHEGAELELDEAGAVTLRYTTPAFTTTASGEPAFCNSLQGPYPGQEVNLEGGAELPPEVQEEITAVYRETTRPIPWRAGDVAVLLNTRLMHGREASTDEDRALLSVLSDL